MNRRVLLFAGTALCLMSAGGCRTVGRYLGNRAADLADVFTLEFTVGPGADLHAQVTGFLGTAAGWSKQKGVLLHGRHFGVGTRETIGALLVAAWGTESDDMHSLWGQQCWEPREALWGMFLPVTMNAGRGVSLGYLPDWPHTADVEVGASLGVGVHLGVSPGEMLDFVLGFLTVDIAGDDVRAGKPPPREELRGPPLMLPRQPWRPWWKGPRLQAP